VSQLPCSDLYNGRKAVVEVVCKCRLPIYTVAAVTLLWAFQRSHDPAVGGAGGGALPTTDHARIYYINVTNTLRGGAKSCRVCPRGIQQDRSPVLWAYVCLSYCYKSVFYCKRFGEIG